MTYLCKLKKQNCDKGRRGIATLNLTIILGFVLLLAVFLAQSNKLVKKNYEIRTYQDNLKEQQALAKKMEIKLTEASSVENLEQASKNLNLIAVDKIKYLKSLQASVALSSYQQTSSVNP
ncbi:MAG: hypothetical protein HY764_04300 [Candidatus Portnoybacteria bacterium]|nr:hypothetical protein [Candidatus Portnoybacteria bacterium]